MVAAFGCFWLWHLQLTELTLLLTAASVIALPLALQESDPPTGRERGVSVTRRDLILAIWALVVLVDLHYAYGQSLNVLIAVCLALPLVLTASRAVACTTGARSSWGSCDTPFPREVRPHLVQALGIWLYCALLGGVVSAGAIQYARLSGLSSTSTPSSPS